MHGKPATQGTDGDEAKGSLQKICRPDMWWRDLFLSLQFHVSLRTGMEDAS